MLSAAVDFLTTSKIQTIHIFLPLVRFKHYIFSYSFPYCGDDGHFSCPLYSGWENFATRSNEWMKMVEKMFLLIHPSKSIGNGIPRCTMLFNLCNNQKAENKTSSRMMDFIKSQFLHIWHKQNFKELFKTRSIQIDKFYYYQDSRWIQYASWMQSKNRTNDLH